MSSASTALLEQKLRKECPFNLMPSQVPADAWIPATRSLTPFDDQLVSLALRAARARCKPPGKTFPFLAGAHAYHDSCAVVFWLVLWASPKLLRYEED
mmetsp:Transcript_11373/g.22318  ORF Transcript_11373/g.22318 Transcript_11373/m.22318 type:complete len:98 (-) Transcript_11373:404-697(-)